MAERLYVLKSLTNRIVGSEVYRTKETAEYILYNYRCNGYENIYIDEIELEFAKRSVCYLRLYQGFDYGTSSMYDVDNESKIFSCSDHAKKHLWWRRAKEKYDSDPEKYYMDDYEICSYDKFWDEKFSFGDVMEGKFRLSIVRLKVRR